MVTALLELDLIHMEVMVDPRQVKEMKNTLIILAVHVITLVSLVPS